MKTIKKMTGRQVEAWLRKKGLESLADEFGEHCAELYDHKDLATKADRLDLLDEIEKKWRSKRCSVVTLVLYNP